MKIFIDNLNGSGVKTYASCCGHGKYDITVVVMEAGTGYFRDLFTNAIIPRKKRFYKKDEQGYYYIPEVLEKQRIK